MSAVGSRDATSWVRSSCCSGSSRRDAVGEDQLDGIGRFLHHDVELAAVALARPLEHVVGALGLVVRLADADPDPGEVVGVEVRSGST